MPLLFKDDTITQSGSTLSTLIDISWSKNLGRGVELENAKLYEQLNTVKTPNRLYTPPFNINEDHDHKHDGQNAITFDLNWNSSYGTKENVLSLDGADNENGPWTAVARIGTTGLSSMTRVNEEFKLDFRTNSFGTGQGDGTEVHNGQSGFAKPSDSSFDGITGYKIFSSKTWGQSSFGTPGLSVTSFHPNGATKVSFWYIVGNNTNGGVTPGTNEKLEVTLLKGLVEEAKFEVDSTGSSVWVEKTFPIASPNEIYTLRFKHIGVNDSGTDDYYKTKFGVANIRAFTTEDINIETSRKFHFTFDDAGVFATVERDTGADGYTLFVRGRETDAQTFKWYRFSINGTSKANDNIVRSVNPKTVATKLNEPMSIDNGESKWWLPRDVFVKNGNNWTEAKEVYVKNGGSWEKVYPHFDVNTATTSELEFFSAPEVESGTMVEPEIVDARVRISHVIADPDGVRDWIITGDNGIFLYYDGNKPKIGDLVRNYLQDTPTYTNGLLRYFTDGMPYDRPSAPNGYDLSYLGTGGSNKLKQTGSIKISAGGTSYLHDTFEWRGYFVPKVSGKWRFGTGSDDGSAVWLGRHAVYGGKDKGFGACTRGNALVQNLYNQSHTWRYSQYIRLTANQYYPMWIVWYEKRGDNSFSFGIQEPGGSEPKSNHMTSTNNSRYQIVHRGSGWR